MGIFSERQNGGRWRCVGGDYEEGIEKTRCLQRTAPCLVLWKKVIGIMGMYCVYKGKKALYHLGQDPFPGSS